MRKTVILISIIAIIASSCGQGKKQTAGDTQVIQDTVVVKHINVLSDVDSSYISKSYSYYWLAGKDTLDFFIKTKEYKRGDDIGLDVYHKEPMLFAAVLEKIEEGLPLIEEDFDMSKLTSFFFRKPAFYLDMSQKLSGEYEQEFGRKNVSQARLNDFLLTKSSLNTQLNQFLNPLHKKVKRYGFEKFYLIHREHYKVDFPDFDMTEYPDFVLDAMGGIWVVLENKQ